MIDLISFKKTLFSLAIKVVLAASGVFVSPTWTFIHLFLLISSDLQELLS